MSENYNLPPGCRECDIDPDAKYGPVGPYDNDRYRHDEYRLELNHTDGIDGLWIDAAEKILAKDYGGMTLDDWTERFWCAEVRNGSTPDRAVEHAIDKLANELVDSYRSLQDITLQFPQGIVTAVEQCLASMRQQREAEILPEPFDGAGGDGSLLQGE